jgi:glycosyltransferase involved in cell wall biosynthesis
MNSKSPKFSVIIPTYNRKDKLKKAIESVKAQTFSNYEIFVVDDASEDGTSAWVSKNYPDINLIALVENKGAAGARNEAIKQAQGEYIAFLDSDDQWLPHYLEAHIEVLSSRPNVVLSASDFVGDKEEIIFSKVWSIYPNAIHHMLMAPLISTMTVAVVRKSVLVSINGP